MGSAASVELQKVCNAPTDASDIFGFSEAKIEVVRLRKLLLTYKHEIEAFPTLQPRTKLPPWTSDWETRATPERIRYMVAKDTYCTKPFNRDALSLLLDNSRNMDLSEHLKLSNEECKNSRPNSGAPLPTWLLELKNSTKKEK